MTGAHTYVIRYTIDDALGSTDDGQADFYWNLIPGGWRMPIQGSKADRAPAGEVRRRRLRRRPGQDRRLYGEAHGGRLRGDAPAPST